MQKESIPATEEAWDERRLGADEKYVDVVPDEVAAQILEASGTQLISIRMQKSVIEDMKLIASLNGLGYQTLMKQIIARFVECEKKQIFRELVSEKIGESAYKQAVSDVQCQPVIPGKKVA